MSVTGSGYASVASVLDSTFVVNCCNAAAYTIYTYDRCLTCWWEVNLIWRRRSGMSVATGSYLLLHISITLFLWVAMVTIFVTDCESYYPMNVAAIWAAAIFHFANGAFTALRAYAISHRSVPLAAVMFLLSGVDVAMDIYQAFTLEAIDWPQPVGCVVTVGDNPTIDRPLYASGQASVVIPEVLLLVATWRHAYGTAKLVKDIPLKTPLTTHLIRDGTLYFVAILALMVLNVILDATSTVNGVIIPIIYALQTSLLSHFYINLHKANKSMAGIPTDVSQVSDPRFARVVGTLAGSLAYGKPSFPEDGDVDGDWEMAADEYLADLPDVQQPATASDNKLHDDEAYAADHISIGHSFIESVPRVEFGVV